MSNAINILSIILILFFVKKQYARHRTFLLIGVLFSLTLLINYPLRIICLDNFDNIITRFNLNGLQSRSYELSFISFVGIISYILGYLLIDLSSKGYGFLYLNNLFISDFYKKLLIFLFIISATAKFIKVTTGNYISFLLSDNINYSYANILENFHNLGWLALVGVTLLFFYRGWKRFNNYFLLTSIYTVQLSYQLFQGSKTFLTLPILLIIFSYYYIKRKIPISLILLIICWLFIFVFPFVTSFREVTVSQYSRLPSFSNFDLQYVLGKSIDSAFFQDTQNINNFSFEYSIWKGLERFNGAEELYRINMLVPDVLPYKSGKDFWGVIFTIIPRAVWPDKPIFAPGAEYGKALGTTTSITPFPIGEMYWNLGLAGIIVGMFIWGLFHGLLMRVFSFYGMHPKLLFFIVIIYISELYWITTGEASLAVLIASFLKKIIIYSFIYYSFKFVFPRLPKSRKFYNYE